LYGSRPRKTSIRPWVASRAGRERARPSSALRWRPSGPSGYSCSHRRWTLEVILQEGFAPFQASKRWAARQKRRCTRISLASRHCPPRQRSRAERLEAKVESLLTQVAVIYSPIRPCLRRAVRESARPRSAKENGIANYNTDGTCPVQILDTPVLIWDTSPQRDLFFALLVACWVQGSLAITALRSCGRAMLRSIGPPCGLCVTIFVGKTTGVYGLLFGERRDSAPPRSASRGGQLSPTETDFSFKIW